MLARLLSFCFLSALFSYSSFANQFLMPHVFVPREVPRLVVAPSPEAVLRERLRVFFNEYRVDEERGHAIEDRIVAQLLAQYQGGVSLISERDFLPFLLDCLNVPSGEHAQIIDRVSELGFLAADPAVSLIRAVYESGGVGSGEVGAHVRRVAELMDAGVGFLEAYWTDFFRTHGLTEAQTQRAATSMCGSIERGVSVRHAYWHSVLLQFGFHESRIHVLVERAIALEGQELSDSEILTAVLFEAPEGVYTGSANVFRLRIAEGLLWVEAFYCAHYSRSVTTPLLALRAAQAYVAELDYFGFQFGVFERIIYEQYGFPRTVARAAVDCLHQMREENQGEDAERLFWWAAFRVLGVREDSLRDAYTLMLEAEVEGLALQRAFEKAYAEVISGASINLEVFLEELDRGLSLWVGEETRIETLLDVLWGTLFPSVTDETRAGALTGFLQSPSTFRGIWVMLERMQ